jgi:glycosyltransferase involved in cell wall biosynthesis
MKVALVHDWLTGMRGGEKVLECLCELFPQADIFTLVHVPGSVSKTIESHAIHTSPLQKFPDVEKRYRHYLPFMPWAVSQLDLTGFDFVFSSSHCVAKGVRVPQGVLHACYCHTPMRYVWDQYQDYFGPGRASLPVRTAMGAVSPFLRRWDVKTSSGVTHYIANSDNVRRRIQRFYGRESDVIFPPVDTDLYNIRPGDPDDFYLMVTAFAPYKRVDIAIEAFRRLGRKLVIIGGGQEEKKLRSLAGENVDFKGWLPAEGLKDHYARCRALIFPGEEDFGIVPVEAMASGRPVIAYGRGGATETVTDGISGVYFPEQTADSLADAVLRSEKIAFDQKVIRGRALYFSRDQFFARTLAFLKKLNVPL